MSNNVFCCYCGRLIVDIKIITKEHILPKSKGGNNSKYNLKSCCKHCNVWRGNMSLEWFKKSVQRAINLKNKDKNHYKNHSIIDLETMIYNIDYVIIYRDSAKNKLKNKW